VTRSAPGSQDGSALHALLEGDRPRVERALDEIRARFLPELPTSLRDPVDYSLSTSGKRVRPLLFLAAYRAVAGHPADEVAPAVYRLACAIEIVHTYSLVHDDLPCMDDDDLRRGRPTVHRVYGESVAMIAGAALLPIAVQVMVHEAPGAGLGGQRMALLVRELCRAAGPVGMVGGQLLDLEGEASPVGPEALEAIHRAKTGALLTAALRLGAISGGADADSLDALSRYGDALGLAFQIADDILDVVGSAESLGKTAGRDEELSKASYPSLYGLDGARSLARARADEAKAALAGISSPELLALADYVVNRER